VARKGEQALRAELERLRRLAGIVEEGGAAEAGLAPRKA